MKKVTVENYRTDKYYMRVVNAVKAILARKEFVSPVELFVEMGLLSSQEIAEWRAGRVPYLERVLKCNLSAASRILRLLWMHAHDLDLRPSSTGYVRRTRGGKLRLRFTKTGDVKLEDAYARHFEVFGQCKAPANFKIEFFVIRVGEWGRHMLNGM